MIRRVFWQLAGRLNEVRASRALAKYYTLSERAGKYFARLAARDHNDDGTPFLGLLIGLAVSIPAWAVIALVRA